MRKYPSVPGPAPSNRSGPPMNYQHAAYQFDNSSEFFQNLKNYSDCEKYSIRVVERTLFKLTKNLLKISFIPHNTQNFN